jgi:hypothetical protein
MIDPSKIGEVYTIALLDALDGLMAWDFGCSSSGIHDETLRKWAKEQMKEHGVEAVCEAFKQRYREDANYGDEDLEAVDDWLRDFKPSRFDYLKDWKPASDQSI